MKKLLFIIALFALVRSSYAQPGTLDSTFNPGTGTNDPFYPTPGFLVSGKVYTTAIQSDGKIIIGGDFWSYNGVSRKYIARLNADGSLDTSFNVGTGPDWLVRASAIQSDGKIIIGGMFTNYNGIARNGVARLNTNGTLDTTFNPNGINATNAFVHTISIQSDGKIIVGGSFLTCNTPCLNYYYPNNITRLNTNGSYDGTFNPSINAQLFQGANNAVWASSIQSDGKIIIGGNFSFYNGIAAPRIARLNTNGTLDTSFNPGSGPTDTTDNSTNVYATCIQSNGRIIIGGDFNNINGGIKYRIDRLGSDGLRDYSLDFVSGFNDIVSAISIQSDGKIIVGGNFTSYNYNLNLNRAVSLNKIARLNADGSPDIFFNANTGIGANGAINTTAIQSDGKIIIAGDFTTYNGIGRNRIARVNGASLVAPSISYVSPQNYTVGTAINPLTLNNVGGSVPPTAYGKVTTFAGTGVQGAIDGNATVASFRNPYGLDIDSAGNLFVADMGNNKIRKITPTGIVSTFAGSGGQGSNNGTGTGAQFNAPRGIVFQDFRRGDMYVADSNNNKIRTITDTGIVSTCAGIGSSGSTDGAATTASFYSPQGVVNTNYLIYLTDTNNNKIRRFSPGTGATVFTYAGSGIQGSTDGIGTIASFSAPRGIVSDAIGNIYVADSNNNKIRKIDNAGLVSTFAGSGIQGTTDGLGTLASFNSPVEITIDSAGNLYVTDANNNKIRKITPTGMVSTLAGSGVQGAIDGIGSSASFNNPAGLKIDVSGIIYVGDYGNNKIRKITTRGYSINPTTLPAGLTFDATTGIITGTPTALTPPTTYTVSAYNAAGSSSTTIVISTSTLGSNDFLKTPIKLFPNPTNSILYLSINDGIILNKVTIVDITGKVVLVQTDNLSTINVEKLAKGIYILIAYSGDKKYQEKFIKE